jgi:hypothetical protein
MQLHDKAAQLMGQKACQGRVAGQPEQVLQVPPVGGNGVVGGAPLVGEFGQEAING